MKDHPSSCTLTQREKLSQKSAPWPLQDDVLNGSSMLDDGFADYYGHDLAGDFTAADTLWLQLTRATGWASGHLQLSALYCPKALPTQHVRICPNASLVRKFRDTIPDMD